jgi:hypothetical protein
VITVSRGSATGYAERHFEWGTERDGKEVRYSHEHDAGFRWGFKSLFFSLFPIDEQL